MNRFILLNSLLATTLLASCSSEVSKNTTSNSPNMNLTGKILFDTATILSERRSNLKAPPPIAGHSDPEVMIGLQKNDFIALTVKSNCSEQLPVYLNALKQIDEQKLRFLNGSGLKEFAIDHRVKDDISFTDFASLLEQSKCIVKASNNGLTLSTGEALTGKDFSQSSQSYLKEINFEAALVKLNEMESRFTTRIKRPIVAVFDSGVEYNHPELIQNLWYDNSGNTGFNLITGGRNPIACDYPDQAYGDANPSHGTHISGIIGAEVGNEIGIAGVGGNRVRVMNVKTTRTDCAGETSDASVADIINGINLSIQEGASVINFSNRRTPNSNFPDLFNAISNATQNHGIVFSIAAMNEGMDITADITAPQSYGSKLKGVIVVGAFNATTKLISNFSNFGVNAVKIAAPGSNIITTNMPQTGKFGFTSVNGTSFAAPIVGTAAAMAQYVLWGRGYDPTAAEVEAIILASANKYPALYDYIQDGNSLNMLSILQYIDLNYPIKATIADKAKYKQEYVKTISTESCGGVQHKEIISRIESSTYGGSSFAYLPQICPSGYSALKQIKPKKVSYCFSGKTLSEVFLDQPDIDSAPLPCNEAAPLCITTGYMSPISKAECLIKARQSNSPIAYNFLGLNGKYEMVDPTKVITCSSTVSSPTIKLGSTFSTTTKITSGSLLNPKLYYFDNENQYLTGPMPNTNGQINYYAGVVASFSRTYVITAGEIGHWALAKDILKEPTFRCMAQPISYAIVP